MAHKKTDEEEAYFPKAQSGKPKPKPIPYQPRTKTVDVPTPKKGAKAPRRGLQPKSDGVPKIRTIPRAKTQKI
jgi:hypothetical protein